ncbi:MAG: formylglycine-generating enzyme family protein [Verrucomicrobiaceae bacterium]|nr:formylglycine-generating enzyme family protein [Verrucomicrobiaceae bacterium]
MSLHAQKPAEMPLDAEMTAEGHFPGQSRKDNAPGIIFHWCPPGEFMMGSPQDEPGRDNYEVMHPVKLTKGFWLAETEVTQGQWEAVTSTSLKDQARKMLADEALYPHGGRDITLREALGAAPGKQAVASVTAAQAPNIPMYYVSWDDAVAFCAKFTDKERKAGRLPPGMVYALPTEAQWEYSCRAGTTTATYAGEMTVLGENNAPILNDIAWYGGNSSVGYRGAGWTTENWPNQAFPGKIAGPRRVGQKTANPWGLKDMLGNLYEWVSDYSAVPTEAPAIDPIGPPTGTAHPYRGGAWKHYATMCRAAKSFEAVPTLRSNDLGFRVALVPDSQVRK